LTSANSAGALPLQSRIQKPSHVRYVVMLFLCVLSFLTYFDRVGIMRAQGDMQRDLHISDAQMGWIFSVFWGAYALFEIPGGWLGDRFGARSTLTRIVFAWSLFTALTGSAVGFASLFTYRLLFGIGEAGAFPNIARVQWRWLPASAQGRASGFIWLMARWGGAFSPVIFGSLLRLLGHHSVHAALAKVPLLDKLNYLPSWGLVFWVSGLFGIAWILLFYPWFRDNPAEHPSVNAGELAKIGPGATNTHRPVYDARVWKQLLTDSNLWFVSLYYAFGSFTWSFFVSWLPRFLKQVHHLDYAKSEWRQGMPLFFGGISCLLGGSISDLIIKKTGRVRFGRAFLPITGRLIAAVMILLAGFAHSPNVAIFFLCVCMLAHDLGQGPSWATVVTVGGFYAGTAAGFVNTVTNLGGNFLQPILGERIFNHYGWHALFIVYALIYFFSAATWLFINPERTFYHDTADANGFQVIPSAQRDEKTNH
jgi:ACS family glucarate transporter-like MFS transporter